MAYDLTVWNKAKSMFQNGYSLSEISKETGIKSRSSILRKSEKDGWTKNVSKSKTNNKGYVYLLSTSSNDNLYKIGLAVDVDNRIKGLQSGNPYDIVLKGKYYCKDMYAEERMWHTKFKDKNYKNEWFNLEIEDVESFINLCNDDLLSHINYLESLLSENKIDFKGGRWLD